ncbi:MAG: VPLPA-CTERM sorting domain-containing protein [Gammaproteobacteria bacterium]|nr:VPLPA-CTERM sorting domain-containing protein [Gammaproteobacteria bacterium]
MEKFRKIKKGPGKSGAVLTLGIAMSGVMSHASAALIQNINYDFSGTMEWYDSSGTLLPSYVDNGVTGAFDFANETGYLQSGRPFAGYPWVIDTVAMYRYDTGVGGEQNFDFEVNNWNYYDGSLNKIGQCREVTGNNTCIAPGGTSFSQEQVVANYAFSLANENQIGLGTFWDWSVNLDMPILWVMEATGINPDGSINVFAVDTDLDGTPGAAMLTDLFPGQTAAFSGTLSAVPLPAAVWLFGSGLLGLVGVAARKKMTA